MEISDVRLKLVDDPNDRLRAVCSITFDGEFVVRDLKVVQGANGLFVAMPSRKLSSHCPQCGNKNHIRSAFCNSCGSKLPAGTRAGNEGGIRTRLHTDVAHPISPEFRAKIEGRIIEVYQREIELARDPNYQPVDIDAEFESEGQDAASTKTKPPRNPQQSTPLRRDANFDFTDYNALIAGLRGGATRVDSEVPEISPPSQLDRERRGSRPAANPRGKKQAERSPQTTKRNMSEVSEQISPRSHVAPPAKIPPREHQKQIAIPPRESSMAASPGIHTIEERVETPAPQHEKRAEPMRVPLPLPDNEGELPFGAGIL